MDRPQFLYDINDPVPLQ